MMRSLTVLAAMMVVGFAQVSEGCWRSSRRCCGQTSYRSCGHSCGYGSCGCGHAGYYTPTYAPVHSCGYSSCGCGHSYGGCGASSCGYGHGHVGYSSCGCGY